MDNQRPMRRHPRRKPKGLWQTPVRPLILLAAVLLVVIVTLESFVPAEPVQPVTATPTEDPAAFVTFPTEPEPSQPADGVVATATIGAMGDLILHDRIIEGGKKSNGIYNFDNIFSYIKEYVSAVDYAVINMEGTLAGDSNGYEYKGYPRFNAPDAIVDAAKAAGFDMMLTANNHSYDTGTVGFTRTQQTIAGRGLDYTGTRLHESAPNYLIRDIGGIKVGMSSYTFDTGTNANGSKTINSISLTTTDSKLINTFNNWTPDDLYTSLEPEIQAMKEAGAECIVLFIHWGTEYNTAPNDRQHQMAQKLCDMGVDVIVGSHPHVVQPVELLTSANGHTTRCLYSLGNAVSKIRTEDGYGAHTEDGMLFTFDLVKYQDGTVLVEQAEILPTWVDRHVSAETGREVFAILPLDQSVEWQETYSLSNTGLENVRDSFDRTQAVIGDCLNAVNTSLARQQAQVEAAFAQ